MKISIITDIEGVSGSVWGGYGLPLSGELPYYTEMMTAEIAVIIRTLQKEGVDDIFLYEAHTLQPGILPKNITIAKHFDLILDSDAVFFTGTHGPANVRKAVLAHTMNSTMVYQQKLNGLLTGELTLCAAYAGALGIPTVFVAGEKQVEIEGRQNLPEPVEYVVDEIGYSNHSAICRPFTDLKKELEEKTRAALSHIGKTKPFDLGKITWKTKFRRDYGRRTERPPFRTYEDDWEVIRADNMIEAWNINYEACRTPGH
ncbi:MAG: M55 family metallopeptidase [Kiritimatiellaeota bacterium]|nr:M55 family metallopeptidase [Kiritimatiellota bacterium]